jgi:hypothetical protein
MDGRVAISVSVNAEWVAVSGRDTAELLESLGLIEVGASHELPRGEVAYIVTPQGWLVLVSWYGKLKLPRLLPAMSQGSLALYGLMYDTAGFTGLEGWRGGAKQWSATRDVEMEDYELKVEGDPPVELAEISARLSAAQAAETEEVDHIIEAPGELGEELCGFRPDRLHPGPWTVVKPVKGRSSGPAASGLPAVIRAELVPVLADLGWTVAPVSVGDDGERYDAWRIRNGRLEAIWFLWSDDRRDLQVIPRFAVVDGETPDGKVLARFRYFQRRTFGERVRIWLQAARTTYEEKVHAALAKARTVTPNYDEIINSTLQAHLGG